MSDQNFFNQSAKQLSGSLTAEEAKDFQKYLKDNPEKKKHFREFEKQWEISGQLRLKYKSNPQLAWEKFSQIKSDGEPRVIRWVHFATRLAAMILLTIGLGFLIREIGKNEPYHHATFEGETKWVVLPDSSKIRLNEYTLLTVAADFNQEDRNVILKGEAYFEIERDEKRPFIIQTEGTKTQVLGTSFNIRAIEAESQIEIYVVSGKVSFSGGDSELVLTKGMAANFDKSSDRLTMGNNQVNALAWHSNSLKFEDAPLDQVMADLQDYFDVDIFITDQSIKNCRFTGEFKKPELEEILRVISISTGVSFTENNNSYTIKGEGCPPQN